MEKNGFDEWCIIELFGHQKIAGRVTEQQIGGCSFVRVDVPATKKVPAFTRLIGNGAIYAINISNELTATMAAEMYVQEPMDKWTVDHYFKQIPEKPEDDEQNDIPC